MKKKANTEQIKEWKSKYKEVFEIEIDGYFAYLKRPDRKTLKYMASSANDPIRANEVLLENCWLGGDEIIKTDDSLFLGVSAKLAELVEVKQAAIKKL